ncbi:MAG: AarF/ABC1/UbiB kinase family protein [Acidobacteriota bacterium]
MQEQRLNGNEAKRNEPAKVIPFSNESPSPLPLTSKNELAKIETQPLDNTNQKANQPEDHKIGLKGLLRLLKIFLSFALFSMRLLWNRYDWRLRKHFPEADTLHEEGEKLREKLIKLGPTFIKIGQTLATRADLLPVEYIQELTQLQDRVPPFPSEQARRIVEQELHVKIADIFQNFDDAPIAAASLGQVHRAVLQTGQTVAVKIQRPNITEQIEFDLKVLRRITTRLERYPNLIRGLDWTGTLNEFRSTIYEEMDYAQEVRNAEVFKQNFVEWREVYVPRIFAVFSTRRVIVMEFIEGFKVTDVDELEAAGLVPHEIIKLLAKTYFKQLLEDGFFHADPHPGNLRVMRDGRLAFFDFGMVGRMPVELQSKLINAFFHIVEKDVHGLVEDMIRLGFIELKPEEEERFKPVIQGIFDRYLNLKLKDVNFKELTFDLAHVIYEFPFRIPASFTYIVRAIMTLEGIGTQVDPNFNFFEVAKPYAKGFMFKREGRYLLKQLVSGDSGNIEWNKVWKLAKMALKYYWQGENKL